MQETGVQTPGWEDFLEKETATHPSTLVQEIPWTREPGKLQSTKPPPIPASPVTFSTKAPQIVLTQSLGWGHPTCYL